MTVLRLVGSLGVLSLLLFLYLYFPRDFKLPDFVSPLKVYLAGLPKVEIPEPSRWGEILGLSGKVKAIDIQKVAQSLPEQIQNRLPQIEELVTATKKEELYLKSPKSFDLPEVRVENYDQELTVQLPPFEVKDSRKTGAFRLSIVAKDLVGEKGRIGAENIVFRLKGEHLEVAEGKGEELQVEEGATLKVFARGAGLGKGLFRLRPIVSVRIPQGSFSGAYRAEIESVLE